MSIHNTDALHSNLFKVAGKMVTASVCHGGPGLPVFPKAIYSYFQDPNPDDVIDEIAKEDLVDMEVIDTILKLVDRLLKFYMYCSYCNKPLVVRILSESRQPIFKYIKVSNKRFPNLFVVMVYDGQKKLSLEILSLYILK
jgi:hypothetical protein